MKHFRLAVPALLLAVLAACSVPVSQESVDLGLGLESQRIVARRPPIGSLAAQAAQAFEGEITVTAKKVEDRLTITDLELPIEFFESVVVSPEDAIPEGLTSFTLSDFSLSLEVTDGASTATMGDVAVPVTVSVDLDAGTGNWELDAGASIFSLIVLDSNMQAVNDIITGDTSDSFTLTATLSFNADVPEEIESFSFQIEDGEASMRGKVKVL